MGGAQDAGFDFMSWYTLLPGNGRPLSLCHIKILEGGLEYYLFFWRILLRYALQGLLPGHCNNFAEAYDKY